MTAAPSRLPSRQRQRGAALIVSLLLLAVVMLLATAGWQMGSQEERMVGQQRDRAIAFEAAEATLRDAERDLLGSCASGVAPGACTPRTALINGETGFGAAGAENTCSTDGLCLGSTAERPDFSSRMPIMVLTGAPGAVGLPVLYGTFTRPAGDQEIKGPGGANLWRPRYVIESLVLRRRRPGDDRKLRRQLPLAHLPHHRHRPRHPRDGRSLRGDPAILLFARQLTKKDWGST